MPPELSTTATLPLEDHEELTARVILLVEDLAGTHLVALAERCERRDLLGAQSRKAP
jgi:hypothetical protein